MGRMVGEGGFFHLRASITLLLCAAAACSIISGTLLAFFRSEGPANSSQRILTFAERVTYQRAIEEVYWRHRIWPKDQPDPKPSLDAVISQEQLETKVADYLGNSQALEDYWQRPITPEQLQAEMERIASHANQPGVLRELFAALGNDPFVIAECLARPVLAERLITELNNEDRVKLTTIAFRKQQLQSWLAKAEAQMPVTMVAESASYALPVTSGQSDNWTPSVVCTDDTWTSTSLTNAPAGRYYYTAVWTGSEMIVWGGYDRTSYFNTGGRYNPSTDSWVATSTTGAPDAREAHTAVWTGTEMIVWGGTAGQPTFFNTGGRYNPSTDSWTATSTTNAPDARYSHAAVWTGSEMIVWGGWTLSSSGLNTGGRYNSNTDSWTATSTTNAPAGRFDHTAIWTGGEMIVWGGRYYSGGYHVLNTGGRYCAAAPGATPTPTPTVTATATPTSTSSPTARPTPVPRVRPTPAPRP